MENTTFSEPNYSNYYTAVQLMLPMDISKKINENDPVVSFAKTMKGMNLRSYVKKEVHRDNQGYIITDTVVRR